MYEYEHRAFQDYDEPDLRERFLNMLDTYGRIRMPDTVALLLRVALLDEAYDETMQWFREHQANSGQLRRELVRKRTPEAGIAEQVLELLDEWAANPSG